MGQGQQQHGVWGLTHLDWNPELLLLTSHVILGQQIAYASFRILIYKMGTLASTLTLKSIEQGHGQGRHSICVTFFVVGVFP